MIKIAALRQKKRGQVEKIVEMRAARVRQELESVNYVLSDQNCEFLLNRNLCVKEKFIAVQARACPCVGLYKGICFLVTVYISTEDVLAAPRLINDARVFHPNLNAFTLQFALQQVISWNPSYNMVSLLRRLKYTIIEPNCYTIPNNPICRKAAYLYRIDRENFRKHILHYSPAVLDALILKTIESSPTHSMEDENSPAKFVGLEDILPSSRILSDVAASYDFSLDFLNKKLSNINIGQACEMYKWDGNSKAYQNQKLIFE